MHAFVSNVLDAVADYLEIDALEETPEEEAKDAAKEG